MSIEKQLDYVEKQPYFKQWLINTIKAQSHQHPTVIVHNIIDEFIWNKQELMLWVNRRKQLNKYASNEKMHYKEFIKLVYKRYKIKYPELFI